MGQTVLSAAMRNSSPGDQERELIQDYGKDRCEGEGDEPGVCDITNHTEIYSGDTSGQPYADNGPHNGMSCRERQAELGADENGRCGGKLGRKAAGVGKMGDLLADGFDDLVAIGRQAKNDTHPAEEENPGGDLNLRTQRLVA